MKGLWYLLVSLLHLLWIHDRVPVAHRRVTMSKPTTRRYLARRERYEEQCILRESFNVFMLISNCYLGKWFGYYRNRARL